MVKRKNEEYFQHVETFDSSPNTEENNSTKDRWNESSNRCGLRGCFHLLVNF